MSISYADYLKLDELLSMQEERAQPRSEDEHLFIVVHQTYELWFKQMLHELHLLIQHFQQDQPALAATKLGRILKLLKLLVHQVDVLETMTPRRFDDFRSFLETSSGLQSYQFRVLEILLGWRHHPSLYEFFEPGSVGRKKIDTQLRTSCLWDYFHAFLGHYHSDLAPLAPNPEAVGLRYLLSEALQRQISELMKDRAEIDRLVELLIDLDEGLQEWRYRHVKMVERTIGNKTGTGGSNGVDYLKKTLHRQMFPDLWATRSFF